MNSSTDPAVQSGQTVAARRGDPSEDKLDYIDAVRGWAIFLVITCHVGGQFAQMPYPVKLLTNSGGHGVQLFFLASAITLMMSWSRQTRPFPTATRNFFIRRFLRIAPMYYLGALIYFYLRPPSGGFDPGQLARSLLFINAWHPAWIPTTGGWMVVPGGWSIGVEFTFYAVFPVLAIVMTTLPRALALSVAAVVIACVANTLAREGLADYPLSAVDGFLYFWFPNQLIVFALGIVLFHVLARLKVPPVGKRLTYGLLAGLAGLAVVLSQRVVSPPYLISPLTLPTMLLTVFVFVGFILVLAKGAGTVFSHRWLCGLGRLSFSAYVLHFMVIQAVSASGMVDIGATGYRAIGWLVVHWSVTMIGTLIVAAIAHKLIEQPGMALAKGLTRPRGKPLPVAAAAE
ncbi:acyltransferase [Rhodospirillum rubrum]|uniref:acyltransferase family protein n=1 Tax=Rhodospirillum rubrum TaxID=1085 RepID=UPI001903933B|nr:acyltransferase [Rhodospirillum rubrum]MBK1664638.1 acyltransferase [Rhodospirillum rubrum]MBK1676319.1 acyltransferase [Rhodospirillum rubrum]